MENLRWILIFAGIAILVLLYFSGRPSGGAPTRRGQIPRDLDVGAGVPIDDPLLGDTDVHGRWERDEQGSAPSHGHGHAQGRAAFEAVAPAAGPSDLSGTNRLRADGFDPHGFEVDPSDLERPAAPRSVARSGQPAPRAQAHRAPLRAPLRAAHDFEAPEPFDDDPYAPAARRAPGAEMLPPELQEPTRGPGLAETAAGALGGLSQKIEAFGRALSVRRGERVDEHAPDDDHERDDEEAPSFASKIVTLHVVAPEGQTFDGESLLACLEGRGLEFGDMNVFHSTHHGKTVFSVIKGVEPGFFDPHDLSSFATPDLALILQLPGPVASDTAFEVVLSEAFEMAAALGGTVLDGERSTLSKQTAQHMREDIYEYMHRQKYFGSVPG